MLGCDENPVRAVDSFRGGALLKFDRLDECDSVCLKLDFVVGVVPDYSLVLPILCHIPSYFVQNATPSLYGCLEYFRFLFAYYG